MYRVSTAPTAGRGRRIAVALALPSALLSHAPPAYAATGAGTRIVNVAGLQFEEAGRTAQVSSNAVTLVVAELLDVAITASDQTISVAQSEADVAVPFVVANLGNADEVLSVSARLDRAAATVAGIAADTDGDGAYDPATDRMIADGLIPVGAGQSRRVFVVVRGAADTAEPTGVTGIVHVATAHGGTGPGDPGRTDAGDHGDDAVVGRSGGTATDAARIVPRGGGPSLSKSQSVTAPDGSASAVAGSRVTYRLDARFPGPAVAAEITDAIPAGTRYVPGSIVVDGRPASDAADDDAAAFDGALIRVALGDIAAASTRSIQFQVKIQ